MYMGTNCTHARYALCTQSVRLLEPHASFPLHPNSLTPSSLICSTRTSSRSSYLLLFAERSITVFHSFLAETRETQHQRTSTLKHKA